MNQSIQTRRIQRIFMLVLAGACLCPSAVSAHRPGVTPLLLAAALPAQADGYEAETDEQRRERLREEAERRKAEQEAIRAQIKGEVQKQYQAMADSYMLNQMEDISKQYRAMRSQLRLLDREQQDAVRHMNDRSEHYRPAWWKGTKKLDANSFEASIWGREFWANYVPSLELGAQRVVFEFEPDKYTGVLELVDVVVLVTWKPTLVDSKLPASGALADQHAYTLGDIAEIIVWHELGHNYITEQIPLKANYALYDAHRRLFSTLHEYYAELTALYHATPRARRIVLQFRLDELDYYHPGQEHCRAAHAIGAIFLADVLENPDAWPSVHLPPSVPQQQVELNTLIYIYEHFSKQWTVEEDIRLQKLAEEYAMKQGEGTFKRKGRIRLPNKLEFELMYDEDEKNQTKRDRWVAEKLKKLIADGRADTIAESGKYEPPMRHHTLELERKLEYADDPGSKPPRIDVPW